MANYQKMYYILCGAVAKAIDLPMGEAKRLLQAALHEAEEVYIRTCGEGGIQDITGTEAGDIDGLGLPASVVSRFLCFSSERDALRQQMEALELWKAELLSEEERLKTMSVEQLLEMNHAIVNDLTKQLDALQDRCTSLYINNDVKRQDIYKTVDMLCQAEPLDHIYIILRQLLLKAQGEVSRG